MRQYLLADVASVRCKDTLGGQALLALDLLSVLVRTPIGSLFY